MIKKFFTENLRLKLLSVIIAILVWIWVVMVVQPEITIHVNNIPVIYTNTLNLTEQGFMVTNDSDTTVSLKVKGTRNNLARLDNDEITAVVDLADYAQEGSYTIPISVNIPYENISVEKKNPNSINVNIDKKITEEFPVTVYTKGNPKNDFVAYKPAASINTVKLSGPKKILSTVSEVAVTINCDGASSDISENCVPVFFNSSGTKIESNLIVCEPKVIKASCSVLKKKTVPVSLDVNYNNDTLKHEVFLFSNDMIEILGYENDLANITQISTEPIYTAGINKDTELNVKLKLPEGIVTANPLNEVVVGISVVK